jgi:aryl-alcohol dehydrogenase-like predicted oxidoreductase
VGDRERVRRRRVSSAKDRNETINPANDRKLSRREFLKKAPPAIAGLVVLGGVGAGLGNLARAAGDETPKILDYRPLGKTGFKLSDIGMGAGVDDAVIKYAFDRGINYFDTADSYYNGKGEEAFGRALKSVRDKCVISTKHMVEPGWKKEVLMEKVNASLNRLDSDYVDLLFMQGVGDPALFKNEEILAAYRELKEQGKYRFLCFSTHDTDTVVPAAIESGLFSAAMLMYIPSLFQKMDEMHARLHEAGLGIIAMKALKGGEGANVLEKAKPGMTFAQASIRWALQDRKISTVLISMRTFEHIDEYLKVSGSGC